MTRRVDLLDVQEKLFVRTQAPVVCCKEEVIKNLESSEQESLNMASYLDHFLLAIKLNARSNRMKRL